MLKTVTFFTAAQSPYPLCFKCTLKEEERYMSIIYMLIIGGIVGWAAARIMGHDTGILASIVIGIVGSFIGGLISFLITGSDQSYLAFSWVGLFWAFIGSIILVAIAGSIMSSSRRHHHSM
jgi:uncharacterized membrane protein YeaQ/YmgE (transglycosylase-associated protein family)